MQKWTVEISFDDGLVADGYDVSVDGWLHMKLMRAFPYARGNEIEVNIISAPDPEVIKRLQNGIE